MNRAGYDLNRLSGSEFEELVYWLLHREGFFNVSWYGHGGSDKGRDILCERSELFGTRILTRSCVVQCKKYGRTLKKTDIYEDLLKAAEHQPDCFILVTSNVLSANAKDWITSQKGYHQFDIIIWEKGDVEILLSHHQDLGFRFLDIPVRQDYFTIKNFAKANPVLAPLESQLLDPEAERLIAAAGMLALERSNIITTAHLLAASLEKEDSFGRKIFSEFGIDPAKLARFIERAVLDVQPKQLFVGIGVAVTESFARSLLGAKAVIEHMKEVVVTEKSVFLSIVLQERSETVQVLRRIGELDYRKFVAYAKSEYLNRVQAPRPTAPEKPAPSWEGFELPMEFETARIEPLSETLNLTPSQVENLRFDAPDPEEPS